MICLSTNPYNAACNTRFGTYLIFLPILPFDILINIWFSVIFLLLDISPIKQGSMVAEKFICVTIPASTKIDPARINESNASVNSAFVVLLFVEDDEQIVWRKIISEIPDSSFLSINDNINSQVGVSIEEEEDEEDDDDDEDEKDDVEDAEKEDEAEFVASLRWVSLPE